MPWIARKASTELLDSLYMHNLRFPIVRLAACDHRYLWGCLVLVVVLPSIIATSIFLIPSDTHDDAIPNLATLPWGWTTRTIDIRYRSVYYLIITSGS